MALKRFLAKQWQKDHAQKRGGELSLVSFDGGLAESRYGSEPTHGLSPVSARSMEYSRARLCNKLAISSISDSVRPSI
jgi:hypothetical protein